MMNLQKKSRTAVSLISVIFVFALVSVALAPKSFAAVRPTFGGVGRIAMPNVAGVLNRFANTQNNPGTTQATTGLSGAGNNGGATSGNGGSGGAGGGGGTVTTGDTTSVVTTVNNTNRTVIDIRIGR